MWQHRDTYLTVSIAARDTPRKILLIAQSNNAVDQLVERLNQYNIPLLRLGSQASSTVAKRKTFSGYLEHLPLQMARSVQDIQELATDESILGSILFSIQEILAEAKPGENEKFGEISLLLSEYLHETFLREYKAFQKHKNSSLVEQQALLEQNLENIGIRSGVTNDMTQLLER